MFQPRKNTLAASFVALLAAAPAIAQQTEGNQQTGAQTGQTTAQQTGNQQTGETDQQQTAGGAAQQGMDAAGGGETEQASDQTDREMPQAATPEGQGLSDVAEVDRPEGTVGAGSEAQGRQQGQTVMLDIEGFSQALYERGFRQGYIRGIADARERLASQMRNSQAMRQRAAREGLAAQEDRMESAAGSQTMEAPGSIDPSMGGQPLGDVGQLQPGGGMGDGGAIIVLPRGMTPQMFVDRVMEMNQAAQQ